MKRWIVPLAAAALAAIAALGIFYVERRQPPVEAGAAAAPPASAEAVPLKPHAGAEQRNAVLGVERRKPLAQ